MIHLLLGSGLRYNEKANDPGAQTERRGEAGPVSVLLRGWDSPAAFIRVSPDEPQRSRRNAECSPTSLRFSATSAVHFFSLIPNRSVASARKRFSSSSSGLFFSIHRTAWSYHLRASSLLPSRHCAMARKKALKLSSLPLSNSSDFSNAAVAAFQSPAR